MKLVAASGLALAASLLASPALAADAPSCGLANGQPATGAPIPLGAIVSKTGPDDFSASARAADAYFKCINQNGGINGRPVEFTVADDMWSPEQAAQAAAKLVVDRKVVALVGSTSFVECAANAKLYERENVLAIAGVGVPRDCFTAKNYVPLNAGPRLSSIGAARYAAERLRAKSFVCIGPNIPNVGQWSCDGVVDWARANNLKAQTIVMDPGSADATSVVLQAAAANPDAIVLGLPKGVMVPILNAAEQQGLADKIKFVSAASGYDAGVPGAIGPYWDGKFAVNLEFQPLDGKGADNQNWLAIMQKYAKADDPRDTFAQAGYLAARVVTETLLKLDPAKIDRPTVTAALREVKGFKSDMLCSPWYVGPGERHNANHAGRMAVTAGKTWKDVGTCTEANDPELVDVIKVERELGLTK